LPVSQTWVSDDPSCCTMFIVPPTSAVITRG
jgi:hypothetical protein